MFVLQTGLRLIWNSLRSVYETFDSEVLVLGLVAGLSCERLSNGNGDGIVGGSVVVAVPTQHETKQKW